MNTCSVLRKLSKRKENEVIIHSNRENLYKRKRSQTILYDSTMHKSNTVQITKIRNIDLTKNGGIMLREQEEGKHTGKEEEGVKSCKKLNDSI